MKINVNNHSHQNYSTEYHVIRYYLNDENNEIMTNIVTAC